MLFVELVADLPSPSQLIAPLPSPPEHVAPLPSPVELVAPMAWIPESAAFATFTASGQAQALVAVLAEAAFTGDAAMAAATAIAAADMSGTGTMSAQTAAMSAALMAGSGTMAAVAAARAIAAMTGAATMGATAAPAATAPFAGVATLAAAAVANPSIVAAAQVGANGTPIVCDKPTGTLSGDLMFAFHVTDFGTYGDMSAPAGWTLLTGVDRGSNLMHLKIWYKTAGGSEASTYSFPQSSGDVDGCVTIITLRTVNTTPGTWLWATPVWSANSGTRTAPSVAGSGAILLCHACVDMNNVSSGGWTPPSGMTEQSDVQSRTWATQSVASLLSPANPSGTKAFTVSSNQNSGYGGIEWSCIVPAG